MQLQMPTLLSSYQLDHLTLPNRLVMAPMTRGRAEPDGTPTKRMVEYYASRSDAGLLITEATPVTPFGVGWVQAPRMFTDKHEEGWKPIVEAVHKNGGRIVLQLWHMGRASHPDFLGGELPVSASAITPKGESHTPNGPKPYVTPRALEASELEGIAAAYALATKRALRAGFDGVELHGANGYLLDQFTRDGSNQRTDQFGGSIENRCRFPLMVVDAVVAEGGAKHVGYRVSPRNKYNDMSDSDPVMTFAYLAGELSKRDLLYLHIMEPLPGHFFAAEGERVAPHLRRAFSNTIILNGGYNNETAEAALSAGEGDLIAFGIPFLANPDLVRRYREGLALNKPRQETFYTHDDAGYNDYPLASA